MLDDRSFVDGNICVIADTSSNIHHGSWMSAAARATSARAPPGKANCLGKTRCVGATTALKHVSMNGHAAPPARAWAAAIGPNAENSGKNDVGFHGFLAAAEPRARAPMWLGSNSASARASGAAFLVTYWRVLGRFLHVLCRFGSTFCLFERDGQASEWRAQKRPWRAHRWRRVVSRSVEVKLPRRGNGM